MQREIDELKKKLRHARRRRSSPKFESFSEETDDAMYRRRSRILPSENFWGDKEYSNHKRKNKSLTHKGLGNKALNEVLNQVAKSPFTRRIEGVSLPRRFHQPSNPVWGLGQIWGWLTKEEMEIVLQEELKGIYSGPKPIRGEQSPRNICSRWLETSQSP